MTVKSWVKGRLYLGQSASTEASPLGKAVDFSYDMGHETEDVAYAGAAITTVLELLSKPGIDVNWVRDNTEAIVLAAARYCRDSLAGVKFYLYLDITNEATVYAYGYAMLEGVSLAGGAADGMKGSFTLRPGPEAIWDDARLVG